MSKLTRKVLLLKAEDSKYEDAFHNVQTETIQFDVHFADVLEFEYTHEDKLQTILLRLDEVGALLITSPRAGIAIQRIVKSLEPTVQESVISALRSLPVFSVGKATSREVECFGITCLGDDCGSADALSQYIHEKGVLPDACQCKPTIFLCGDKRRDALPMSFKERHLPFEELVVYVTVPVSNFQLPITCTLPDWVVYFSPSGINVTRSLDLPWNTIKKAAIGKTTAAALQVISDEIGDKAWMADVVASKPNADSLAASIVQYEKLRGDCNITL